MSVFRKISRFFIRLVAILLLLVLSLWLLIQTDPVQNWLLGRVTTILSRDLKTSVSVRHINFIPFNQVALQGVLVRDLRQDTLLYAGAVNVNITDWFFLKSAFDLEYIGLQDARVNLTRSDSTWNYGFLVDYFSTPGPSNGSPKKGAAISLKEVRLSDVVVSQVDKWIGQDMVVEVGHLHLQANEANLNTKKVDIDALSTTRLSFMLKNYPGNRPDSLKPKDTPMPKDTPVPKEASRVAAGKGPHPLEWNEDGWVVSIHQLNMDDCRFRNEGYTPGRGLFSWFDPQHIDFNHVNAHINHVRFEKDTLSASIATLGTKERSGFEVKKLTAHVKFTPRAMEFRQLDVTTNRSRLRDYFAMRYENFNDDMADFVNKVNMKADLKNSLVSTDDIAFFAPELRTWKKLVDLTGKGEGPVAALKGHDLTLKVGQTTFINGDFSMTGLPDINRTVMNFSLNELRTTFDDASDIVPELRQVTEPNLSTLRSIRYRGSFTGKIDDFVVNGDLQTNLGRVVSDLNLTLPEKGTPSYKGKITVTEFDLGTLTGVDEVGNFSFDGTVDGKGFSFDQLDATLKGQIADANIHHYTYKNLTVEGVFRKKLFDGTLSIDDPNAAFALNGKIQLDKAAPVFNFDADITRLNFQPLGLIDRNLAFQGKLALNFAGRNIDDFTGTARVFDATLSNEGEPLSFDSLSLTSDTLEGKKVLTLQSLPVNARVEGQYHILELPKVVQWYLGKYYPSYIQPIAQPPLQEDFTFAVHTDDVEDYLDLLKMPLSGFDNSDISGRISTVNHVFNVDVNVPEFGYKQFDFSDIDLKAQGDDQRIRLEGLLGEIDLNDSLRLPNTRISMAAQNDNSVIALETSANQNLNSAILTVKVHNTADGISAHFDSSSFVLNDKKWLIASNGEIDLKKNWIQIRDLKVSSALEQIALSTHPSETDPASNDIQADLTNVTIEDLLPLVLKDPRLEGQLNGTVVMRDPFGKMALETNTLVNRFRFESDSIGKVEATSTYDGSGHLKFHIGSDNPHYNFDINGGLDLKDSLNRSIDASINLNNTSLHLLEHYLDFLFSDIDGTATGTIRLTGPLSDPQMTGRATVHNGSLRINYTRCKYLFDNEDIDFTPGVIDFGQITLRDTLHNTAILQGSMNHDFFKDMSFNLRLNTDRLLVLNTTARDNKNFYGKAVARVNASLTGPESNILLKINRAEAVDSSNIYLPNGASKAGSLPTFIVFKEYGREMQGEEPEFRSPSNFTVDMNLQVNSFATIYVLLDPTNGDVVRAQGNGNLLIRAGTATPLTINGTYNIERGEYTYIYSNIGLRRPFSLTDGSIRWTGDPYKAYIDINASYLAQDVTLPTIITSTLATIVQSSDIIILCHLTNTLDHPDINFEFQLPPDNPYKGDPVVAAQLKKYEDDKSEMNKQVASLLGFGTFISSQDALAANPNSSTIVANTLGQVVAGQLSNTVRELVKKVLKNNTIDPYISINPAFAIQNANQSNFNWVTNAGKAGINKYFLSGRVIVKAGATVDYSTVPLFTQGNTDLLTSPDLAAQWSITPDGHLRLVGYNRTNYDMTYGRSNRTGLSLNYRKDFDRLIDLFVNERKRVNAKRPAPPSGGTN
ncbi:translocation/assembly module TamB domain-containing protein [Dinghuibacter silviterrae]|uniref:Autotransporter translocation and assembly factor TamB n=1 Tax=Dinghuibacter silviterrae TaxID=1539049 RepID=A0A4R8DFZ2_9BACT|nr:translocation/assembly module TamB domain-containing protein [Dinghuibacter silviterrae]TDW96531.1 autotransporter translocation and assembly factor TamB [Dinghuibacter silviterrae]